MVIVKQKVGVDSMIVTGGYIALSVPAATANAAMEMWGCGAMLVPLHACMCAWSMVHASLGSNEKMVAVVDPVRYGVEEETLGAGSLHIT